VPRPPADAQPPGRARPLLAAAFVVVLAFALLLVRMRDESRAAPPAAPEVASTTTPTTATTVVRRIPGGRVEVTTPPDLARAFRAATGGGVGAAASGPARCAAGQPEERAWSQADAPTISVGRYVCRIENQRATLWWSDEQTGELGHATRDDADLGALFAWWLATGTRGQTERR
jgi:predicted outer membrane lipoprotein